MRLKRMHVALLAVALVAAACGSGGGGSSAPAPAPAAPTQGTDSSDPAEEVTLLTYQGDDRTQRLIEGALAEGSVTWYTSLAGPVVNALTAAFRAEFPGIEVNVFRGAQTDLVSRTVQELGANRIEADVMELTSDGALLLNQLGVAAPFFTPYAADVPERWKIRSGTDNVIMVADRASYVGFAYNTGLLDAADVPTSLEGLADPRLRGKLAIPTSTTGVRWVGNVWKAYGEGPGEDILTRIAANEVRLESVSGAALADMIAAGEVVASPGIFRNHALALKADGAPIEWVPLEPVTGNIGYVLIPGAATNPHAGLLFADFLLGPVGTKVKADLFYPPPFLDVGFEIWVPDEDYESALDYEEDFKRWQSRLAELSR
jgi:iron(III) transport system substrate-binding protein